MSSRRSDLDLSIVHTTCFFEVIFTSQFLLFVIVHHYNFTPISVCTPNFGVVKYSYIHPIVLAHCRLLAEDASISEERKRFDVGETFSLCFKFAA